MQSSYYEGFENRLRQYQQEEAHQQGAFVNLYSTEARESEFTSAPFESDFQLTSLIPPPYTTKPSLHESIPEYLNLTTGTVDQTIYRSTPPKLKIPSILMSQSENEIQPELSTWSNIDPKNDENVHFDEKIEKWLPLVPIGIYYPEWDHSFACLHGTAYPEDPEDELGGYEDLDIIDFEAKLITRAYISEYLSDTEPVEPVQ
ncbi:hypothetical protein PSN45_001592 [Yamadazyma tenuis]|uniref:uncharacterized protein n=1 Tax=Candida tenuis TaxID=2315449 RepID=UPI0027A0AC8B|nr:hypothetical protein PSN45_001592 [Yamadazyma tenuis]